MLFYRITVYYECESEKDNLNDHLRRSRRYICHQTQKSLERMNKELEGRACFCLCEFDDGKCLGAIIAESKALIESNINTFLDALSITSDDVTIEEITFKELSDLLQLSSRNDFIEDDDEVLASFGLENVYDEFRRGVDFAENLISEEKKSKILMQVKNTLYAGTIVPEIMRIYASAPQKPGFWGIPVHYMIQTIDEGESRRNTYRALLSALYGAGRIQTRRYWFIDCDPTDHFPKKALEELYNTCYGGTVVIRYKPADEIEESNYASANRELIEIIASNIKKYQNDVLTILCIPADCIRVKEMMYESLGSLNFVEIREERVSGEKAKDFLRQIAKNKNISPDKDLYFSLEESKEYRADELHDIFEKWRNQKLRTTYYPQYSEMRRAEAVSIKEKSYSSAYEELMSLTGLKDAKKVLDDAINYFRAQRIFADKGFKNDRPALSMIFTGNPGSCKTTVARLIAEILKDEGILETGRFIECGRGDLVGRFVGWTAPAIQKKFRDAKGGVLFIDEAYSLVDDRSGSFGDEAINTIVQEMENHRSDVLVIFAGYPERMEGFMEKNPGLRSRIAFHVRFDDYGTDELCQIAEQMAKKKGLVISPEANEKMRSIFDEISNQTDFGNGRAVRNILETAKMSLASRLMKSDIEKVTEKDVITILPEDILTSTLTTAQSASHRVIGFQRRDE